MIDRLRSWLRAWLELSEWGERIDRRLNEQQARIDSLEYELESFRRALKAKVQTSVRAVPKYVSYEASQIEALNDFKEKN